MKHDVRMYCKKNDDPERLVGRVNVSLVNLPFQVTSAYEVKIYIVRWERKHSRIKWTIEAYIVLCFKDLWCEFV